jgi:translation initiation factor 1
MSKNKIVYSTDPDWQETCPRCELPVENCICQERNIDPGQRQPVYLKREVKGRGGKTVTTISNIGTDTKSMQKELQRLCGAGGTTKNNIIEIQGDHRQKIKGFLEEKGYSVKIAGG